MVEWLRANAWWRHQMETFSALQVFSAGDLPVTGEYPAQRPVTQSFDVFFDLRLNKQLSKQSWGWWFETPSRSLWRHSNGLCEVSRLCYWPTKVHKLTKGTLTQKVERNLNGLHTPTSWFFRKHIQDGNYGTNGCCNTHRKPIYTYKVNTLITQMLGNLWNVSAWSASILWIQLYSWFSTQRFLCVISI